MTIDLFLSGLQQSLILALITYGVMLPFRFLDFPDLTSEGAYTLGGAICSYLLLADINPILTVLLASLFAGFLGAGTALVHLKLKVNTLLAGIILTTMAYSIDLRILGKPNLALFNNSMIFSEGITINILILTIVILSIAGLLFLFFKTELGLKFRAVGLNLSFAKQRGINTNLYTMIGLFTASMLSGLAGSFMIQMQKYMDIGMGTGILIHALASLMIGEAIIGNSNIIRQLSSPLIGAITYQQIQGFALSCGLAPTDLKFFTGSVVLIVLAIRKKKAPV